MLYTLIKGMSEIRELEREKRKTELTRDIAKNKKEISELESPPPSGGAGEEEKNVEPPTPAKSGGGQVGKITSQPDCKSLCDTKKLLLEEWKQNVALYIDQDKRGLERIKMFLTVHAGLLAAYSLLWKYPLHFWSVVAPAWLIALAGIFLTIITQLMSKRAHAFILLRKLQGMLIEKKIKELIAKGQSWSTSSGIITTFTREHVSFAGENLKVKEWQPLIDEVKAMGDSGLYDPVTLRGHWKWSMRHLKWLTLLHYALYVFWALLGTLIGVAYFRDC